MAQYYFSMKGTFSNQWPNRISECLESYDRSLTMQNYLLAPGGDSFLYMKDSSNSWDWLPLLKKEEAVDNFEALLLYRRLKDGSKNYSNVGSGFYYRSPNSLGDPCCYISFGTGSVNATNSVQFCYRNSSGTQTFPGSQTSVLDISPTTSQYVYLKISVSNNTHKVKSWIKDVQSEPIEWEATYTSPANTNLKGCVGLLIHGYDISQEIISVSIATEGDTLPIAPYTKVSGILRNPDNTFASNHRVVLYQVKGGSLISETTSDSDGKYELFTDTPEGTPLVLVAYPKVDSVSNWTPAIQYVTPVNVELKND